MPGETRLDRRVRRVRRGGAAALLLIGACAPTEAGPPRPADDAAALEQVRAAARAAVERGDVPGAVVLVGRGDEVLLCEAFGARALEPALEPMTVDTVFDLASLTKPIATATSVMLLVERGAVRLEAPVADYLPEFGAGGKDHVTVEELLRHWGGLVPDNALADYADAPDEAWRRICALEHTTRPGEAFAYTDVGYIVLGKLIERVDGRPLDVFAREELFAPLGMDATGFLPGPELAACAAPTEQRAERWMRGEVHDPRAFALGGVAGHAGLFGTADDLARWCRMLLGSGALEGQRVLASETVGEMLRPRWLADGTGGRALGLDVDTPYSPAARGAVFPRGASLGHTGFTGTSLWLDPETGGYAILLTARVHPDGGGRVRRLRREVATAAAIALRGAPEERGVRTGIDVLARDGFEPLRGLRVGLIANASGRTRAGERTVDAMHRAAEVELVCVLTPEHGFDAVHEGEIADGVDDATGLPIHSLYGATQRPTAEMLAGLDALVFDVQDAGTRFYTYATTLGYAMEAAAEHGVLVVVLDRPNPIGPVPVSGPCADADRSSFVAYRPIPVVHGMTIGELALLFRAHFGVACALEVVPCEGWRRSMWWDETGLPWVNPSPNLRNPTEVLLYPALGLVELTNVSVGRGTDEPFERLGAPWIDGPLLAAALNAAELPGLAFVPIEFTPNASSFQGERCGGVHVDVVDRAAVRPVEAGLALAWHLNRLFGDEFEVAPLDVLLRSRETYAALLTAADPRALAAGWASELEEFLEMRAEVLLYE